VGKRTPPSGSDEAWRLTEHITWFVNIAFVRKLRPNRALCDSIRAALESGYSEDEIRLAFWVSRCIAGDHWLKQKLIEHAVMPELVLRHKGGINIKTGAPAKRWLDELLACAQETNPALIAAILRRIPDDAREGETAMLKRVNVVWGELDGGQGAD
jgi:hypothetical protein